MMSEVQHRYNSHWYHKLPSWKCLHYVCSYFRFGLFYFYILHFQKGNRSSTCSGLLSRLQNMSVIGFCMIMHKMNCDFSVIKIVLIIPGLLNWADSVYLRSIEVNLRVHKSILLYQGRPLTPMPIVSDFWSQFAAILKTVLSSLVHVFSAGNRTNLTSF